MSLASIGVTMLTSIAVTVAGYRHVVYTNLFLSILLPSHIRLKPFFLIQLQNCPFTLLVLSASQLGNFFQWLVKEMIPLGTHKPAF